MREHNRMWIAPTSIHGRLHDQRRKARRPNVLPSPGLALILDLHDLPVRPRFRVVLGIDPRLELWIIIEIAPRLFAPWAAPPRHERKQPLVRVIRGRLHRGGDRRTRIVGILNSIYALHQRAAAGYFGLCPPRHIFLTFRSSTINSHRYNHRPHEPTKHSSHTTSPKKKTRNIASIIATIRPTVAAEQGPAHPAPRPTGPTPYAVGETRLAVLIDPLRRVVVADLPGPGVARDIPIQRLKMRAPCPNGAEAIRLRRPQHPGPRIREAVTSDIEQLHPALPRIFGNSSGPRAAMHRRAIGRVPQQKGPFGSVDVHADDAASALHTTTVGVSEPFAILTRQLHVRRVIARRRGTRSATRDWVCRHSSCH